jgi:segregation and condensation protein B
MSEPSLKAILEGALLAAGEPLSIERLRALFPAEQAPEPATVREALEELAGEYQGRGAEIREVASGFRIQVPEAVSPWVARLWQERPQRLSRAMLETLAIIAYRQPITRGEIEAIRGVTVGTTLMRNLLDREWVRCVGYRELPGRPALYATTRAFLDYFNLASLDQLPTLRAIQELDDPTAGGSGADDNDEAVSASGGDET